MAGQTVGEVVARYKDQKREVEKIVKSAVDAVVYDEVGIGEMFDVEFIKDPDDESKTVAMLFNVRHGGKKRLKFEFGVATIEWYGRDPFSGKDGWQVAGTTRPYAERFRGYLMCLFRGDKEHFKGVI